VISTLRTAVSEVGPNVPVDQIETMKQMVSGSVAQSRFRTAVMLIFALLALFVASIGLYGIMSYLMSQRTREFGIRVAVGASSGALLRLALGQASKPVSIGIVFGSVEQCFWHGRSLAPCTESRRSIQQSLRASRSC
jgi:putative ABC transport system permease protein